MLKVDRRPDPSGCRLTPCKIASLEPKRQFPASGGRRLLPHLRRLGPIPAVQEHPPALVVGVGHGGGMTFRPEQRPALVGPLEDPAGQVHHAGIPQPPEPVGHPSPPLPRGRVRHNGVRLGCLAQRPDTGLVGVDQNGVLEVADGVLGWGSRVQQDRLGLTRIALPAAEVIGADPFDLGKPRGGPPLEDLERDRPAGDEEDRQAQQDREDDEYEEYLDPARHSSPFFPTLPGSVTGLQHRSVGVIRPCGLPSPRTIMRRYLPLNLDLALLILRLALAVVLLYHGLPNLINLGQPASNFSVVHIPAPSLSAAFSVLAEVGGGVLILLGILVDLAGI